MVEKDMQTIFTNYVKTHLPKETEVYELKMCKDKSIPFNKLEEHQEIALQNAEEQGIYHKITDQPWLPDRPYSFTKKKPFDCFAIVKAKAFVVIWFYHPREKRKFIKIRINDFILERATSTRKSLTEERAKAIGTEIAIT